MLKTVQNWAKIANYPPNAQQKFAPQLIPTSHRALVSLPSYLLLAYH